MKILLAALGLLLFAGTASADSLNVTGTWAYQGTTMRGCRCNLSGELVLDSSGDPTAWDFTDGTHTLGTSNSTLDLTYLTFFFRGPEAAPWWKFTVTADSNLSGGVDIFSQFYGSAFESSDAAFGSFESGSEGVWTESVSTAEPGTLTLIGVGLAELLARKRLRAGRSQVPEAVWEPLA